MATTGHTDRNFASEVSSMATTGRIDRNFASEVSMIEPSEIINKENATQLLREISAKIAPNKIDQSIIDSFSNFIRNFKVSAYRNQSKETINAIIVQLFLKKIKDSFDDTEYDIHEMLKHEINKKGDNPELVKMLPATKSTPTMAVSPNITTVAFDLPKYHELLRTMDRNAIIRDAHLFFDTFNRDRSDVNKDRYVFHFENSYSKREGTVNALGQIRDIIELEIYPFELPFTSTVNNYYNKITMLVGEFKQGFIGQEEFHFIFNTTILSNNTVRLTPVNSTFKLRDPITKLDNLTLIFKAPFTPVQFHDDIINCSITYANPARFTSTVDHNLESGDIVYFTNFATANLSGDNEIIQNVNRVEGFTINKISNVEFSVVILDFTTLTPIPGFTVQVKLGSKRALIPLRIGYILPQKNVTDF